jgi:hypothetical protein
VSYILTITNSQGEELWEGQIEGKEEGSALIPEGGRLPNHLIDILKKLPVYHASWEVMGKDVTYDPSRLIASESVEVE